MEYLQNIYIPPNSSSFCMATLYRCTNLFSMTVIKHMRPGNFQRKEVCLAHGFWRLKVQEQVAPLVQLLLRAKK